MTIGTARQQLQINCDVCNRLVPVTRTASPYQFDWCCPCGSTGFVAWREEDPPPLFVDGDADSPGLPFD